MVKIKMPSIRIIWRILSGYRIIQKSYIIRIFRIVYYPYPILYKSTVDREGMGDGSAYWLDSLDKVEKQTELSNEFAEV